ncbi:MAG: mannose-1-phosphate guanylyltransferase/mannose-6-phosphate isomerase [SAR324 cluster bacterium]|nr:mannose-1-phosphate guanylyltransferase/mannose-6-phosphate isomerase [SAR324 cluster bacterium]
MKLIPTILCGGAGSRLWPVSRELHPKPFIQLSDGQSLLQKAFLLGAGLPDVEEILVITNREFFFKTEDELAAVNEKGLKVSFVLEPVGRNTAPAIAAANLYANENYGEDTQLLVLAADHLIADPAAFSTAVSTAISLADEGKLVTFGIEPDAPETGYGYIEAKGNEVLRFVEKPNSETAEQYLAQGGFYWNSGIFLFQVASMQKAMKEHCPEILETTAACYKKSRIASGANFSQIELDLESFSAVPADSIDYAVMEKSNSVAVVPCEIGWSDIGSWVTLSKLTEADANGNRVKGEALLHNTTNCFIQSDKRMVGAIGLNNLIIIDTPDALLVADQSATQDVKKIYSKLKSTDHDAHKLHRTVFRPWGSYTVLEEAEKYKMKRIEVKPGGQLSLQLHHHRSEHWIVVSGMAKVINGEQELFIKTNESTYIPAGHKHRLENPGLMDLVMIEVQSGDYLGEDDIVRLEDIYGRV